MSRLFAQKGRGGIWRVVLAVALGASCLIFTPSTLARTWTDRQGRTVSAKFVRVQGPNVVLKRAGRVVAVPFSQLSPEDQQYVREKLGVESAPGEALPDGQGQHATDDASSLSQKEGSRSPISAAREPRTWTDLEGNTIRAKLVEVTGASVVLAFEGRVQAFPLAGFCQADQQYIRDVLEAGRQEQGVSEPSGGSSAAVQGPPDPFGSSDQQREGYAVSGESEDEGPWSGDLEHVGSGESARQGRREHDDRASSAGASQRSAREEHSRQSTAPPPTSPRSVAPPASASAESTGGRLTDSRSDSASDVCFLNRPVRGAAANIMFGFVILCALIHLAWTFGFFRRRVETGTRSD